MLHIGIPKLVAQNIYKIYSTRYIRIRTTDGLTDMRQAQVGLPQGSVLSPLLFILYTADIEDGLTREVKLLQYVDDLCIYAEARTISKSNEYLSRAMESVKQWTLKSGFSISEEKSQICTFTRKRFQPPQFLKLASFNIKYNTYSKFLGVYLDMKLNWKRHISYISGRAENATNILRAICGQRWGADPNIMLLFYRSLIRSILDYGSLLYHSACDSELAKIEKIKNKCLRICGGYLKSTPINVMEAELREMPLGLRRSFLGKKFLLKIISKKGEIIEKLHSLSRLCTQNEYWRHKNRPNLVISYDEIQCYISQIHQIENYPKYIQKYEIFDNKPHVIIDNYANIPEYLTSNYIEKHLKRKWEHHEKIYTDGSLIGNKVACAFYHSNEKASKLFKLHEHTSIYTAELIAIREAIRYCLTLEKNEFVVFSDSKSALEKIKSTTITSANNHIVVDILKLHYQMITLNKHLSIAWIKGHIGIKGNEKADELAKRALDHGDTLEDCKIPFTDFFKSIRKIISLKWQTTHEQKSTGQFYKSLQPIIPKQIWFKNETSREFIKILCRMRSNHALYPEYLYKIQRTDNPNCSCGELGDLQHLILECPNFRNERNKLYNNISKLTYPVNLTYLLSSPESYTALYQFVVEAGIKL